MIINIIGTDTEIGKTYVSYAILRYLKTYGLKVTGIKPIASGISNIDGYSVNEDAYNLWQTSNSGLDINEINPICFREAIAPHIAANLENYNLTVDSVIEKNYPAINDTRDVTLIEGVGGLVTPLNNHDTYLDLLIKWQYPIILVIGMRLGCLNHSLLTYNNLISNQLNVLGFVVNQIDQNMAYQQENLDYLKQKLNAPFLGYCGYKKELETTQKFKEVFKI